MYFFTVFLSSFYGFGKLPHKLARQYNCNKRYERYAVNGINLDQR